MAKIRSLNYRVELYVFGFVVAPVSFDHKGLKMPPIYALMRLGEIKTPLEHIGILGIVQESFLRPTADVKLERLPSGELEQRRVFGNLAEGITGLGGFQALSRFDTNEFFTEIGTISSSDYKTLRGAVLVPIESLLRVKFSVREGFGFFLDEDTLKDIRAYRDGVLREQKAFLKDRATTQVRFTDLVRMRKTRLAGKSGPATGDVPGFSLCLDADYETINFVQNAMSHFHAHIRAQMQKVVDESNRHPYVVSV